jgi:hypothetical protein
MTSPKTYPLTPPPGKRSFPPNCVTKPELRYEENTPKFSLGRRGFLRVAGIAGVGLGFNIQRCIAGES